MCVRVFIFVFIGAMLIAPAVQASHEAIANFDDGNSSLLIDAYPGMADDDAWLSEWQLNTYGSPTATNYVVMPGDWNYSELKTGTGPYLDTTIYSSSATRFATGRQYGSSLLANMDLTMPYTIDFTVRMNDLSTFDAYTDRFLLFSSGSGKNTTGTSDSWSIFAFGASDGNIPEDAVGKWTFYNGVGTGSYNVANQVNTNVPLVSGGVYDFSVTVNPNTLTWDGSVTDGTNSFSMNDMGCRGNSLTGWLYFGGRTDGANSTGYSVDSVRLYQDATPVGDLSTVTAHFDGGNTDTVVDAFTGKAGDGWSNAWTYGTSSATGTATVVASGDNGFNELKAGSGSYLSVETDHNASASLACVKRNYKATDTGIDWTEVHSIQFTVRIDEDLSVSFDNYNDRYQFSDIAQNRLNAYTGSTWLISNYGGEGTMANAEDVGVWTFYDGLRDGGSGVADQNIASTISVVTGGVYDFTIVVDPETQSYDATVSDGTDSFTIEDLGWRTAATTVGGTLLFGSRSSNGDDYRNFSLDSVIITQGNVNDGWDIAGDANKDGKVDGSDVTILANNWQYGVGGSGGATWEMGDFNGDEMVDGSDVTILANNWQYGVTTEAASVPEPGTWVLMLSAFTFFMVRRRIVK